jgi:hypothetical protein
VPTLTGYTGQEQKHREHKHPFLSIPNHETPINLNSSEKQKAEYPSETFQYNVCHHPGNGKHIEM